ncbi:hypothetical protein EL832_10185 [Salmonella enterica subsp. enterica serovar Hvittingfoss]|nr:hypothetical protein [Salmonella enterica subsp. enterica serovar Hvittingfoss]
MRIIAPVVLTILLSACVSPTQESYGVKITSNHDAIAGCKPMGLLKASDHFFTMWFKGIASGHVDTSIRNQAGRLGADTVLITAEHTSWWTGSAMRAVAYDCKNVKTTTTIPAPITAVQPQISTPTLPKREIQETVISKNGRYVYYTSALWDGEGREPTDFSNYIIGVYDTKNEKKSTLLTTKHSTKPEKELSGFNNLILSSDNNTLYFHSDAWVTSPAIYKMDLKNYKPHYIVDGYLHCLVQTGKYKGDLIVSQHRHYVQGGAYNPISLFTPQGKKLGVVGDDNTTNAGIAQLCNHVSEFGMN